MKNISDTLLVSFNLALSQIVNLDEVNQMMKTNVWLQIYWQDYQLGWNPDDYGGIGSIRVPPDMVWVPDLVLYNNADGIFEPSYRSNVVIYSSSDLNWIPPAIYQSSCMIDVQYFPFDEQVCEMKFGSWTYRGGELKYQFYLNFDKADLASYLKSGAWDVVDCPGEIVRVVDEENGDDHLIISFKFVLRRKALFYIVNLIFPCLLISFLTHFTFLLPADAGEKMTLCISVLLALVFFQLMVSAILPPSLKSPLLANFLVFTFILDLIAIFVTVFIINMSHRSSRNNTMPHWVRVVFLRELPKYLLMKRPDNDERWQGKDDSSSSSSSPSLASDVEKEEDRHELLDLSEVPNTRSTYPTLNSTCSSHIPAKSPVSMASSRGPGSGTYVLDDIEHVLDDVGGVNKPARRRQLPTLPHELTSTLAPQRPPRPPVPVYLAPEGMQEAVDGIKSMCDSLNDDDDYSDVVDDWKFVARVIDRVMLIIFGTVNMVGMAAILLGSPHVLDSIDQDAIIEDMLNYMEHVKTSAG